MNRKKNIYWMALCCAALILVIITFTPLVIPYGIYNPFFLGLPYSLWTSILITIGLVILTFIAGRVYPGKESEGEK